MTYASGRRIIDADSHLMEWPTFLTDHADPKLKERMPPIAGGRAALVRHEQAVLLRAASVETEWLPPALVDGDSVAIRWRFRFHWKNGSQTTLEEVAWQRWSGERIVEEQFFYDPAQLQAAATGPR